METRINASPEWGRPLWIVRSRPVRGGVATERHQTEAAIPTLPGARAVTAAARANSDPKGTPARTLAVGHFRRLRARIGDWNITKGKLKQKWAKLTDSDLQYVEGKQTELVGRIQKRTGETREAVEKAIHESCSDRK